MTSAATIYDVAKRAGVSVSTVSLALNVPSRVSQPTLQRVLGAVDELGFVPKAEAVTRARRGVGRIGVIAPFTSFPSAARRLNGVLAAVHGEPFEVVVFDQESAATSRLVSLPWKRRVDGLLLVSVPVRDEVADRLGAQGIAAVLIELAHPRFTSVIIDNEAGGRMAAEFLVTRGHDRVAFVGHAQHVDDFVSQSEARLAGFRAGLADAGITLEDRAVRRVEHDFRSGQAAAASLLDQTDRPSAIFAHDDLLASAVLSVARERGVAVPGELSVIGFDDGDLAEPLGLTSVRQPLEESGQIATERLLDELAHPGRPLQHTTLGLTIVERGSTRAP